MLRKSFLCAWFAQLAFAGGALAAHESGLHATEPGSKNSPRQTDDYSPLVSKVRRATQRYKDIDVAIAEGWAPATPCVSGPDEGAMGVHYVLAARIGDGELNAEEPEALIYEPRPGGRLRLVGVEFIELAEVWDRRHGTQPTLDGHLLNLVTGPNRYLLPSFYELHVWAFKRNPNGHFADWNTKVTCNSQEAN
jgi:hypothetical protein